MTKITKAVIAAAGFGTRFLPQTKAMPKEMLPLVDKPIIQYVVEELVDAGIKDIIIVTGQNKRSIEDHFDKPTEDLLANLRLAGPKKQYLLDMINQISDMANFVYVRQKGAYGNGTPLLNVEHLLGNEPFIYTFSDDFISATPSRFRQMIEVYNKYNSPVLCTIKATTDTDYDKYGFVVGQEIEPGIIKAERIVEKPGPNNKISQQATVSGYLLTADIFEYLHEANQTLQPNQELYSNQALTLMINDHKTIIGCEIQNGKYYDAGNKLDYVKANIDFALQQPEIHDELVQYLRSIID